MSITQLLQEVAISYLGIGDRKSHDAVMMAINDKEKAYQTYPNRVMQINNAFDYANHQLKMSEQLKETIDGK